MNHEEIRKALDAATPGPWAWEGNRSKGGMIYQHILAVGGDNPARGDGICDTWYREPLPLEWEGEFDILPGVAGKQANAHLIANAPTWLRTLLEENERLKQDRDYWFENSQQERDLSRRQKDRLREELEQVKEERDMWKSRAEHAAEAARHCLYESLKDNT